MNGMFSVGRVSGSAMLSTIRKACLFSLCAVLSACVSHEAIIKEDRGVSSVDVAALEKFGKKVEKYDFAPHRAVLDTSGAITGSGANVMASLRVSCKRAGGVYSWSSGYSSTYAARKDVDTVFSKLFYYKMGRDGVEMPSFGDRCVLPGKGIIEITFVRNISKPRGKGLEEFAVIQEDNDIKATELLIAQMDGEVKEMLQSVIGGWQRESEMLRNDLKPGNTVYLVSEFPDPKRPKGLKPLWLETEGLVVEVKSPLVFVQFQNDRQWVKIEEVNIKVPAILYCGNREVMKNGSWLYEDRQYKNSCFQRQ